MAERSVVVKFRAEVSDFRRQLKGTEQDLGSVAAKAQQTAKSSSTAMGQMVQSARHHEDAWNRVGGSLVGIGVAAAAGVGIAVSKFAEFDQSMSGVAAATHESAGNMKLLRDAAVKAGADTQYSATEAAGAITNLAKAGVSTKDIIGGGLAGSLDLAAAGALDVADAAEYTATTLTQFNLKGDKASHVADVLAAGAGKAQGEVSDMANAMKYAGVPASQLGVSLEETAGTIALLAKNGIIGEQAGTSLRGMISSLTSPSKQAAKTMQDLGIEIFDNTGKFIGLAGVAGQLQTATKDLTDEERANALGRIFGNEQLTAANVLVREGEAAVREWTAAVDDQGYAAETAALMTDNLRGDIERLGGALDTALITTGESSNGVLRAMVQALTGLIDLYGEASPVVKQFALAVGVVTAAVALAGGGFFMLAPRILAADEALKVLARSMPRTVSVVRGLGSALAGPIGLGLAAATTGFLIFAQAQAATRARQEELRASLDETTLAITDQTLAVAAARLVETPDWWTFDFSGSAADGAEKLGINLDTLTQAMIGNVDAWNEVVAVVGDPSKDPLDGVRERAEAAGLSVGDYNSAVSAVRRELGHFGKDLDGARDKQRQMNEATGDGTKASQDAAGGARENRTAIEELADAQDTGRTSAEQLTSALGELVDGMAKAAGQALDARAAQRNYKQSLDDATKALKENGKGFDLNTEAGRANQTALDDVSKSGWELITSMQEQGATQEQLRKTVRQVRKDFIAQAEAMGMGTEEANALADQLGLIPDKVDVKVAVETAKASADVVRWITANDGRRIRVYVDAVGGATYKYGPTGPVARAAGGPIDGPGTATSDSIHALLSNGEYVIRASARAKYGDEFLSMVNAGRFAVGGPVGHVASGMSPQAGGRQVGGVSITVGNIQAVNANAAAEALLTRTRDAVAAYGIDQIGAGAVL